MSTSKRPTLSLKKKRSHSATQQDAPSVSVVVKKKTETSPETSEPSQPTESVAEKMPFPTKKTYNGRRSEATRLKGIPGTMEVTIKIRELPNNVKTVKNHWKQFLIDVDGMKVQVKVRPKIWTKLTQAHETLPSWIASISGQMGESIKEGFELLYPMVQIYEKHASTPEELNSESSE